MSITAWAVSGGVLGSPAHLSAYRVPERKVPVKVASSSFQPTCSITGTELVLSKPTTWAQLHLQEPWGAGVHHPLFSDEQTETQKGALQDTLLDSGRTRLPKSTQTRAACLRPLTPGLRHGTPAPIT